MKNVSNFTKLKHDSYSSLGVIGEAVTLILEDIENNGLSKTLHEDIKLLEEINRHKTKIESLIDKLLIEVNSARIN